MSAGVDAIGILGQIRSDRFAAADRTACPHLAQYAGAARLPGTDLPLDSSLGLTPAVDSRYQLPGRPLRRASDLLQGPCVTIPFYDGACWADRRGQVIREPFKRSRRTSTDSSGAKSIANGTLEGV